jgi:hypothetical protein
MCRIPTLLRPGPSAHREPKGNRDTVLAFMEPAVQVGGLAGVARAGAPGSG